MPLQSCSRFMFLFVIVFGIVKVLTSNNDDDDDDDDDNEYIKCIALVFSSSLIQEPPTPARNPIKSFSVLITIPGFPPPMILEFNSCDFVHHRSCQSSQHKSKYLAKNMNK